MKRVAQNWLPILFMTSFVIVFVVRTRAIFLPAMVLLFTSLFLCFFVLPVMGW